MYLPKSDLENHVQLQKEIRDNEKIMQDNKNDRQYNLKRARNGEGIYGITEKLFTEENK